MGGYVRSSALAPIRSCVDRFGGRIDRVLRHADLPLEILDRPELPLPLKDHYAVLHAAARETGSAQFGAEMGALARMSMLGPYGSGSLSAPSLFAAIARANVTLNRMMQTDTDLVLFRLRDRVKWSMIFHTRGTEGRYQNELLAMGYQLDLLRHFLGASWRPACIHVRTSSRSDVATLERLLNAPVRASQDTPGIEFHRSLLSAVQPLTCAENRPPVEQGDMPAANDLVSMTRAAIRLELVRGRPSVDAVAARLQMSRRSFQRRLSTKGTSYGKLLEDTLLQEAQTLLGLGQRIGEVADRLGYSDHAHFTRAYRHWSGLSPRQNREMLFET
ncbi:AraC family transcriptional regulator ligand-binding domain-containing protein [Salipiger marinus]|uniref:AraC family transcriptional regulator ligand-binding domain-containing protein n=1 Tax=Salipiger marinus TaxID=555512 RepID=UPI00405A40EB